MFSYFLITYGVCKKRKYCNRMSEKKKNSLLFLSSTENIPFYTLFFDKKLLITNIDEKMLKK